MTKQAKAKLPKVWVVFNADGVPIAVEFLGSNAKRTALASDTIREYAPVQPPRRCVWKPDAEQGWWGLVCDGSYKVTLNQPFRFCHVCGGKIVRKS